MTQAMTHETPAKVFSLLGVALASLAFLFMVTISDASFEGSMYAIPDPFAPQQVVALLDTTAHGYAMFLNENLFAPAQHDYAIVADNVSWIAGNSRDGLVAMLGIESTGADTLVAQQPTEGMVAGAYTTQADQVHTKSGSFLNRIISLITE